MAYNKYGNVKKVVDGISFDSTVESRYYEKLRDDKKYGHIKMFIPHPPGYILLESYQLEGERKQSAVKYNADFFVVYLDGTVRVIDVKGGDTTPEFKIKKKMFESKFGLKLWEVRWKDGKWVEN